MDCAHKRLRVLHEEVDRRAAELTAALPPLRCERTCHGCCSDGLTVSAIEAQRIQREFGAVLASAPHAEGGCAFLGDEGECRIYAARPYVCRTQGLPLRWFEEEEPADDEVFGEVVEGRDICPLNAHVDVTALPEELLWTLGGTELELLELCAGSEERVALRALFEGGA